MTDSDVVVCVVVKNRELLLVQRARPEGRLIWQFPGGVVENGETKEAAVSREVLEETGLVIEKPRLLGQRVHPDTGRSIHYFTAAPSDLDATLTLNRRELADGRFVRPDEVEKLCTSDLFPAVRDFISHLARTERSRERPI